MGDNVSADKINHKQFAHLYLLRPTLFQYMCAHVYKNIQIVNEQVKTEPGVGFPSISLQREQIYPQRINEEHLMTFKLHRHYPLLTGHRHVCYYDRNYILLRFIVKLASWDAVANSSHKMAVIFWLRQTGHTRFLIGQKSHVTHFGVF